MSPDTITWIWFLAGVALIGTELFLPGLVVCFLGLAAMVVAGLRWVGLLPGLVESFTAWFVISIVFLVGLRHLLVRWLPSEKSYQVTDEDVNAIGTVVDVVQQIGGGNQQGRIRFGGTTWPAIAREGMIPAGAKAKIVLRDNLIWIVEPYLEIQEPKKD